MIIDTKQIKELLDNENISTNQIQRITGFNRKNVWSYRSGNTKLVNMKLKTLVRLQKCYDKTHDSLMKYKNFEQVIDSFNGRYGQTDIYLNSNTYELHIVYDGIVGYKEKDDVKIVDKDMCKQLNAYELLGYLKDRKV